MTNQLNIQKTKKKKIASLDKRKARGGWLFVLPFIIGFVLVYLPLVFDSLKYSFCLQDPIVSGMKPTFSFVGWTNYKEAILHAVGDNGQTYVQVLLDGLQSMIFDIPMILIFSLFMAVLLNQKMGGRAVFRAIFFVPVIIATGVMQGLIEQANVAMDDTGMDDGSGTNATTDIVSAMDVEKLFSGMAVGQGLVEYVVQVINNIYNIVNRSGVQMLIFLAGLQSISPAIYESVQIDGATAWETFWKITFPMISPMILVNGVYTVIDAFTMDSNVVMTFIKNYTEKEVGTAMAWMYFLIVIAIIAAVVGVMSAFVFYQRRD